MIRKEISASAKFAKVGKPHTMSSDAKVTDTILKYLDIIIFFSIRSFKRYHNARNSQALDVINILKNFFTYASDF